MRSTTFLISILIVVGGVLSLKAQDIIPKPKMYKANGEVFQITSDMQILYSDELKAMAGFLGESLSPATGWDFELKESISSNEKFIALSIDKAQVKEAEGYSLSATRKSVVIVGADAAGVFNGIQTLLQMLPVEIYNKQRQKTVDWKMQGAEISDSPQYPWRGMMLDVSRYFYNKEYVLHLIDMMSMYKMNVLHLHLIDDAGWRLEIKKYPKLTSVGAWRGEGEERTGGYYTQEDIKEIVAYATLRNVDVIPEIEIPAHTLAAISAYPWLSCTEEQHVVPLQHFISKDLYCVGKESTFEFIEDVFKETFELFPSKYLHVGGDEAHYDRWKECEHCQARKQELGLESEKELQVYFTNRIQKMAAKHGKIIVGWDEIIERGLDDKAVGMVWYDQSKAISGTEAGHDVVMALTGHCYFDVAESKIPGEVKAATWLKPISLEKVYALNPMIEGLDEKYRPQVLGAHATLWSDQFINGTILQEIAPINENRSEKYMDYLTFPRMAALAEVCWTSKELQSWDNFENRMRTHYNRLGEANFGYRMPQPKLISKNKVDGSFEIVLENVVNGAKICYTTDGIKPNVYSKVYSKPVSVENLSQFQAITVVNRHQYSLPLYFPEKYDQFKKYGELIAEWTPEKIEGKDFGVFEMNATGKINENGTYELAFWYTNGDHRLEIDLVEIFKNGNKIAEDDHPAFTGGNSKNNVYTFEIDDYETGAAFTVIAKVRGDVGNDSYGAVFIKKK
jgi:hexosaminidase